MSYVLTVFVTAAGAVGVPGDKISGWFRTDSRPLMELAVGLEIIERQEVDHYFLRTHPGKNVFVDGVPQEVFELRLLLLKFVEFLPYPTPSEFRARFPSREDILKAIDLNLAVRRWAERTGNDRLARDLAHRRTPWDLALLAHGKKKHDLLSRRRRIRQLYLLIGPDDFWRGSLPPIVPFWAFPELGR